MAASYLLQIFLFITCFEAFFTQDDQRSSSVTYTLNFDESPETAVNVPQSFNVQKTIFVKPNNDIKVIEGGRVMDAKPSEIVRTKILPPHRFLFPKYSRDFVQMYRNQMVPELQVGCEEGFTSPLNKEEETKPNIRKSRDVNNQNKTRVARQIYPIYPIPVPIYDYPRYVDPNPYYWRSYPSPPYPWQQPPPPPSPTPAAAIYPIPFYPGIQPPSWSFSFQPPHQRPTQGQWPNRARNIPMYDFDNRHNNHLTPTYVNPNEDRQYPYPPRLSNDEVRRRLGWSTTTPRPNQIPPNPAEICTEDYIRNCPGITRIDGEVRRRPIDNPSYIPPYPPASKPTLPPPFFTTTTPTTITTRPTTRGPIPVPSRPSTTLRPRKPQMESCQESDLTKCPGFTNINVNANKPPIPPFIPPPSVTRPPLTTTTTSSTTSTTPGTLGIPCNSDDISECPGFSDLDTNFSRRPPKPEAPPGVDTGEDYGDGEDEDYPGGNEEEELLVVPPSVKEKESFNYDFGIPEDCVEDDITKCKGYNPVTIPPPPSPTKQTPHADFVHCDENDITKCPGFSKLPVEKQPQHGRADDREKRDNAGRCVWAIVTCCKRDAESIRKGCFTIMGCPETHWKDLDPCGEPFSQKTLAVTKKYFR